jgi:hypothetical protein
MSVYGAEISQDDGCTKEMAREEQDVEFQLGEPFYKNLRHSPVSL